EIATAIGAEKSAGILAFLAIAEEGAEHTCHALVPWQLHESLRLRHAHQLGRLRPVAEIFAVAVEEEIDGSAVGELGTAICHVLPMIGRDALTHDSARHRYELKIEILDSERVDLGAHLLDQLLAPRSRGELLIVAGHALASLNIQPGS